MPMLLSFEEGEPSWPAQSSPKAVHQLTAAQFDTLFQTEDDCVRYLVARRWPEGVVCPRCGNPKVYALASGHHWQCYTVRA